MNVNGDGRVVDTTGYIQLPEGDRSGILKGLRKELGKPRCKKDSFLSAASTFPFSTVRENCKMRNMGIEITGKQKLFSTL